MRAVQFLWDAQHPDRLPRYVAAALSSGERPRSCGQGCLALFVTNRIGFYVGLGLIALGSGGIKPCVASFVGDQFDQTNKHRAKVVFDAFYWSINFGSFFASALMPIFLRDLGPRIAFGIPGSL